MSPTSADTLSDCGYRGMHPVMQAFELPPPLREDDHGVVRVVGSRVTLDSIVAVFDRGATPEEIVQSFPSLALGDVYAVLAWGLSRRSEVDSYLARRGVEEASVRADVELRFPSAGRGASSRFSGSCGTAWVGSLGTTPVGITTRRQMAAAIEPGRRLVRHRRRRPRPVVYARGDDFCPASERPGRRRSPD
jgi:uncharacterized protein (DUF433 family)